MFPQAYCRCKTIPTKPFIYIWSAIVEGIFKTKIDYFTSLFILCSRRYWIIPDWFLQSPKNTSGCDLNVALIGKFLGANTLRAPNYMSSLTVLEDNITLSVVMTLWVV